MTKTNIFAFIYSFAWNLHLQYIPLPENLIIMKDGQLLRVKVIKTNKDLPKENGEYWTYQGEFDEVVFMTYHNTEEQKEIWRKYVTWYLQPIEEQECEHPFASVQSRCNGDINHCLKCGKNL